MEDYSPPLDGGWHIGYTPSPNTTYTIPAGCTITGIAELGIMALNGDVNSLISYDDTNDHFFVAGSLHDIITFVDEPIIDPIFIAKEYTKKIKGFKFTVRESDPYKIFYPGTINIHLKMRRWKISIAAVMAFDMNGNKYFEWVKTRILKRENKNYTISFNCTPGSWLNHCYSNP